MRSDEQALNIVAANAASSEDLSVIFGTLTHRLAEATVDFAREQGTRALEGYPMDPEPGKKVTWDEIHVGHRKVFEAAGFRPVSHPSKRRCVMRIEF